MPPRRTTLPILEQSELPARRGGNPISDTDERAFTTYHAYDAFNREDSTTDPLGYSSSLHFDPVGRITVEVDGRGYFTYHELDALGQTTDWTHDGEGNALSQTNATGYPPYYVPDALGRERSWGRVVTYRFSYGRCSILVSVPSSRLSFCRRSAMRRAVLLLTRLRTALQTPGPSLMSVRCEGRVGFPRAWAAWVITVARFGAGGACAADSVPGLTPAG